MPSVALGEMQSIVSCTDGIIGTPCAFAPDGTPIAWHGEGGWQISPSKYSMTTSRHQGIVRRAIFEQGHDNARI